MATIIIEKDNEGGFDLKVQECTYEQAIYMLSRAQWVINEREFQVNKLDETPMPPTSKADSMMQSLENKNDELLNEAARIVFNANQGSVSLLQRRLQLGYNRAGRIMDQLVAAGIVGPPKGIMPRDIIVNEDQLNAILDQQRL